MTLASMAMDFIRSIRAQRLASSLSQRFRGVSGRRLLTCSWHDEKTRRGGKRQPTSEQLP